MVQETLAKPLGASEDTGQRLSFQSCGFGLRCTEEAEVQLFTCVPSQ